MKYGLTLRLSKRRNAMDNDEQTKAMNRIAAALEKIASELDHMNHDGITVWGGSTMEEN